MRVRALGGDRAGEMRITRFLRNGRMTLDEMAATAAAATASRVKGRHILAIQDTTSLRDDGAGSSLVLHPTIAVDALDGALLGLVGAQLLGRSGGLKALRKQRPLADKQSRRWLDGAAAAASLLAEGAAAVTVIADREGDIYEDFAHRPAGVHLLIRAAQDRCLANAGGGKLFATAAAAPELGGMRVPLAAAPGRPARVARVMLRATRVAIARPRSRPGAVAAGLPDAVPLTLLEAREVNPPDGVTPAHWRLLTTHAVDDLADACEMIDFYRARWTIEQLFRTLKTRGFDIEAVRIADDAPFEKLALASLIAAIDVLKLVRDRDGTAKRPITDVFDAADQPAIAAISDSLEGKTQRQKNPQPPGSLAFATWVCARLGGWTGYYGKPGPITVRNGLLQLRAIQRGYKLRRHL